MKDIILFIISLCFISVSCSNYMYVPKKGINKTLNDESREGLWITKSDTTDRIIFTYYKDNIEKGEYREYHSNGKIAVIGKYKNGKKDGTWKRFTRDGHLSSEIKYKGGEPSMKKLINLAW